MAVRELRREQRAGLEYGPGCWFCVPHDEVLMSDGRPFSERVGGSGRRVVLADSPGPNSIMFARSTSRETAFSHPAHVHNGEFGSCALDRDGWIVYRLPVSVRAAALCDETFSCREPDGEWLLAELRRAHAS